jgi:hypothetical protein
MKVVKIPRTITTTTQESGIMIDVYTEFVKLRMFLDFSSVSGEDGVGPVWCGQVRAECSGMGPVRMDGGMM